MFVILFCSVICSSEIIINKTTSFYSFSLEPRSNTTFKIDSQSVTFYLPTNEFVSAEIYILSTNNSYQFIGSVIKKNNIRGVHFPNKGKLILRASKQTTIDCHFILSSPKCQKFFLSTYPNELFFAAKPNFKFSNKLSNFQSIQPNITIQNKQDICFLHISNSQVSSYIKYSTEESYDIIFYKNSQFTGEGEDVSYSNNITYYYWHSDSTTLSNFFFVNLSSHSTLTKYRFNFAVNGLTPLFLTDNSNLNPIYDNADSDLTSKKDTQVPASLTIGFLVFLFSILMCLAFLFISTHMAKKEEGDDSLLESHEQEKILPTDEILVIEPNEEEA